jgi:hypothetical protein
MGAPMYGMCQEGKMTPEVEKHFDEAVLWPAEETKRIRRRVSSPWLDTPCAGMARPSSDTTVILVGFDTTIELVIARPLR